MGNPSRYGLAPRWLAVAWLGAAFILPAVGCGGDSPPKAASKGATKKEPGDGEGGGTAAKGKKGAKKPKKGEVSIKLYSKVEDVVDAEEAKKIRHKFVAADFNPDPVGNERRDPFRSYVVVQAIKKGDGGGLSVATTEVCTEQNMVAPDPLAKDPRARMSYSLRDLQLVGIVLRGTKSYALFRDTGGFGHTVTRGDCLGKEKAKVVKIGAGFVRLEVIPDPLPNQPAREPQKREIQLHPEEMEVDELLEPTGGEPPTVAPSPATPSPGAPPPAIPSPAPAPPIPAPTP